MSTNRKTELHYSAILEAARVQGKLSTKEAAQLLQVSDATVRRLFNNLEKQGRVIRTFGGISYAKGQNTNDDYFFDLEFMQFTQIKQLIGSAAANTIVDGDIIYIDAGSTTLQFAHALHDRLQNKEVDNLIVVTNSIAHVHALSPLCTVFATGGEYQKNSNSFVGALAEDFVAKFNYTKCFVGCDGFSPEQGASSKNLDSARISQHALSRSTRSYLLTVSNKMEAPSFYSFTSPAEIDCIVTDTGVPDAVRDAAAQCQIELMIVD